MVAWLNACERCARVHSEIALELGVDGAALEALGDFASSPRFTPAERAALAAAVALTREPRALPAPVTEELERFYDAGEIVEIVAAIGLHNYVTRVSNALREPAWRRLSRPRDARDDALDLDQARLRPTIVQQHAPPKETHREDERPEQHREQIARGGSPYARPAKIGGDDAQPGDHHAEGLPGERDEQRHVDRKPKRLSRRLLGSTSFDVILSPPI